MLYWPLATKLLMRKLYFDAGAVDEPILLSSMVVSACEAIRLPSDRKAGSREKPLCPTLGVESGPDVSGCVTAITAI